MFYFIYSIYLFIVLLSSTLCYVGSCCNFIWLYILTINMRFVDKGNATMIASCMGKTWGPSGADRPRWAPCWPHKFWYLGMFVQFVKTKGNLLVWVLCSFDMPCLSLPCFVPSCFFVTIKIYFFSINMNKHITLWIYIIFIQKFC